LLHHAHHWTRDFRSVVQRSEVEQLSASFGVFLQHPSHVKQDNIKSTTMENIDYLLGFIFTSLLDYKAIVINSAVMNKISSNKL